MTPWIEKYRPTDIYNIKFNNTYKDIFNNIINTLYFPNLIFYGPPGTGKTTTFICLLNKLKDKYGMKNNIIHLNASDDRGIEVIRNILYTFVNTNNMYNIQKIKFVVLDEVDSMTNAAQNSLISLLDNKNVKSCLICNYVSKLIPELRNKCNILRFYNDINYNEYLNNIIKNENISIKPDILNNIINTNKPDIRCMINCLESYNYNYYKYIKIKDIKNICENDNPYYLSKYKNYDKKYIFESIFIYMINNYNIDEKVINYMEELLYNPDYKFFNKVFIKYFINLQN